MDNSANQSRGGDSSFKTEQLQEDSSKANTPAFVNHGLLLWNQNRQQWLLNKKANRKEQLIREPKLSWNATYDSLLGSNKPFPQPIPLGEMVDFLVDIWEQEGLYD
ncbi:uncharacterized protein LOC111452284 isoform X2 [Cucurbita moschata]|uniref:Uncharacterized protein LOC111452284 isoform X2 n=1 Tax=Cucurbita moschata TaxID=3662 RepID=A0A6J1GAN2_CUCMO|nr:uncharacterized protein LOC111452284 isoform X2 [Cucurbita moschata]